ncbi:MAG: flagellin FliC [Candidatus Hydrogenedentes bacterium]|nr:flagellin FliC [Candidatus Hydrogenedentota bacterium]
MGLVINTNIAALNATRVLRRSTLALNKSLERLSSGLRINRASDDAAGLAIAEGLSSQVRGLRVAQRNAQDGINLVQIAEGSLSEVGGMLQRMRELAVQAANGTNTASNRADLDAEFQQLKAQITDTIDRTEFNGIFMLTSATPIVLQTGADGNQTTAVGGTSPAMTTTTLTIAASVLTGADATNPTLAIAALDNAIGQVTTRRAALGATQNRLEFTINTLAIQEENSAAAESAIRDADIALETIAFTRAQILVAAGTSVLAQANLVPQTALQLLG